MVEGFSIFVRNYKKVMTCCSLTALGLHCMSLHVITEIVTTETPLPPPPLPLNIQYSVGNYQCSIDITIYLADPWLPGGTWVVAEITVISGNIYVRARC